MDSEHRHELKENDLARFLAGLGTWWKSHGLRTLVFVLVVLLVFFGWKIMRFRSHQEHEQIWAELSQTSSPDVLRSRAPTYDDPTAVTLANLWGAARYNARASLPIADDSGSQAKRDGDLDHAETMLTRVISDTNAPKIVHLNALMFKGAVKENRGDFENAAKIYEQVKERAQAPGYEAWGQRAKNRLKLLEKYGTPVVFGPEPAPPDPDLSIDNPSVTNDAASSVTDESSTTAPGDALPSQVTDDTDGGDS